MSDSTAFKHYYNLDLAHFLAGRIAAVYPEFDEETFVQVVAASYEGLEFKERIRLFSTALRATLPPGFPEAWSILERVLGPGLADDEGMFNEGFGLWPLAQFIEEYGLDDPDVAVGAMYEITQRHTAEFAIRPFLNRYPDRMLAVLEEWTADPSPHVRRLVSEGTRTRLPWGPRLKQFIEDPTPTLALIEKLKDDESEYVRRSVANHLNDIGKDHPDILLETARAWMKDADDNRRWIVTRALRSLVKAGDPDALDILGFGAAEVVMEHFTINPDAISMGESITIAFRLRSTGQETQQLVIDYIVHFMKKSGQTTPKVFKLSSRSIKAHESVEIVKNHTIKPITTRTYYTGKNRVEIQVNGTVLGGGSFHLDVGGSNG